MRIESCMGSEFGFPQHGLSFERDFFIRTRRAGDKSLQICLPEMTNNNNFINNNIITYTCSAYFDEIMSNAFHLI